MRRKGEAEAPESAVKVRPSRVKRRREAETRRRRRAVIIIALAVGLTLALGAALDIPYINLARVAGAKLGELLSSSPGETGEAGPSYLFLTHPRNGSRLEGDVSVLLALYADRMEGEEGRTVLGLALFTYSTATGAGEVYIVPEDSVAYDASGRETDLRRALREDNGDDLLIGTVSNLAGEEVDYLVEVEFWEAVRVFQGLRPPPLLMGEDTVLVNSMNGESDFLARGQEVRDTDRLLLWLLGADETDRREAYARRGERARLYLEELREERGGQAEGLLSEEAAEGLKMRPSTASWQGDREYLLSMLRAFLELEEGDLVVRAVPRVEVLNGCGLPDLGKKVGERLLSLGVPLAGTGGNAKINVDGEEVNDFTHQESVIIYRSEAAKVAAYARYLGVLLSVKEVRFETGAGPEVVLIAGRDLAAP
ncbi:MAG: LytR C-terminal domain-containing protein [Actinobacteria bacterium]|nr:LytR C-terminal domain-containing protein [Actinomycetota bacterium]